MSRTPKPLNARHSAAHLRLAVTERSRAKRKKNEHARSKALCSQYRDCRYTQLYLNSTLLATINQQRRPRASKTLADPNRKKKCSQDNPRNALPNAPPLAQVVFIQEPPK
jgi:hypothetical protein